MYRLYEESDSNLENSSLSMENIELRFNPSQIHVQPDSFDSLSNIRYGSDTSFISISYQEENKPVKKPALSSKPLRQPNRLSRPLSILKTTFLEDDSINYDLPKRLTPDRLSMKQYSHHRDTSYISENKEFTPSHVHKDSTGTCQSAKNTRYAELTFKSPKILPESEEKISNLENTIIKKDALIETLRTRIVKMVEELEETHKKLNNNKSSVVDDLKIIDLQSRCQDFEARLIGAASKEKELNLFLDKKDEEINLLTRELRSQRLDFDGKSELIRKLENELDHYKQKIQHLEAINENLKIKVESSMKAVEISSNHKNHIEQEVVRLEVFKRNHENEMNLIMQENSKSLENLRKKYEDSVEEGKNYQRLLKDAEFNYETLKGNNSNLYKKLQYLEEQLRNIDQSIRIPLKEKQERSNSSNNLLKNDKSNEKFINKNHKTCETCERTDKSFRGLREQDEIIQQVMEILKVGQSFEIIPNLKRNLAGAKEKKLVKKICRLIKDCLNRDEKGELSCGQAWRIIKRVFEDYAKLVKDPQNIELKAIKQQLGEENCVSKVSFIVQENKKMKEILAVVKKKLRLSASSSLYELESAIGSMGLL